MLRPKLRPSQRVSGSGGGCLGPWQIARECAALDLTLLPWADLSSLCGDLSSLSVSQPVAPCPLPWSGLFRSAPPRAPIQHFIEQSTRGGILEPRGCLFEEVALLMSVPRMDQYERKQSRLWVSQLPLTARLPVFSLSRINEKSVWCCGWLPCTPLRIAATAGHGNCVDFLIRKGAEVDLVDVKGQTALYVAVVNGHLESAQILLEAGADPNGSRHHRSTPVYHASRVGRADILKALIRSVLQKPRDHRPARALVGDVAPWPLVPVAMFPCPVVCTYFSLRKVRRVGRIVC